MTHKLIRSGLIALIAGVCASAAPWWDDFPRMVDHWNPPTVAGFNGSFAMSGNANDPTWGTFFQASAIDLRKNGYDYDLIEAFQNVNMKQIYYSETYGQSVALVAELGAWDETNLTPIVHHHWNWQSYSNGAIRWLGAKNFFDDEDYARPYTRTHPRYGGTAMTYPDGTVATGYNGSDTDPRNSRVYDAACTKGLFGDLFVEYEAPPTGSPTNGLFYIPETGIYAGHMSFGKDATCPLWTNYAYASTLQAADAGLDGMWTDNYGPWDSLSFQPVKRAFGDWSVARFRDFLSSNYSLTERFLMGVPGGNATTFDIREYLKDVATGWGWDGTNLDSTVWSSSAWLDDPLWRAYLIFKRQTGTEALSNFYNTVKSAALAGGKTEFLVAGNDIPGFSLGWCRGDLDMVSTEMSMGWQLSQGTLGFTPPPVGRYAPFYKLAREHAKSRFVNVWLYNDHYEDELSHAELANVMYYEMLASHTLPRYEPTNPRITGYDADIYKQTNNAAFFGFVEQVTPIFGDRVPVEDIGIYYSSSSVLRQLTPGGYENHNSQPHQFGFWGWGTALGELHYQYRAVPEWKLTSEMLDTLRVLVIPNADVLDPSDVTLLQTWVNGGGRLIITGDSGKYLGESGNFDLNPAGLSIASLTNHANVVYLSNNVGMDYYLAYGSRSPLLAQFSSAMNTALSGVAPSGITDTTASTRTGITLYEDESAGKFFIDVNNFDINNTTYVVTGTGPLEIETLCPSWLKNQRLQRSVVTPQTNAPAVELLPDFSNNTLRVDLGSVEYYAGVVIEKETEWADWQSTNFSPEEIAGGLADIDEDPDDDGITNNHEYITGTNPRDADSVFTLSLSANTGGGFDLSVDSLTGRTYSIWFRSNLVEGVWSMLGTNFPGTGAAIQIEDTNDWARIYYRVEASKP